jgi:hypothetical protein
VAEIDGDADGDLFGASKVSSEKKKKCGSTSYPQMEVWNPKWNKVFFWVGPILFFNFWVLGSWVNPTKPASLDGGSTCLRNTIYKYFLCDLDPVVNVC